MICSVLKMSDTHFVCLLSHHINSHRYTQIFIKLASFWRRPARIETIAFIHLKVIKMPYTMPIKKKPKQKITDGEKEYNREHLKIRICVEHTIRKINTWRMMGNTYWSPLKKYDNINIVCGVVNQKIL